MPLGANKAAIMGVAGTAAAADVVLLATTTISADANIAFTSVLTSAYGEYIFGFYNIHPATDGAHWTFNGSDDTSSHSYDVIKTTTLFRAYHAEDEGSPGMGYSTSDDLAQATGYQTIYTNVDNDADSSCAGHLHLFNPSSTTYVTNFYSRIQGVHQNYTSREVYTAGYFNITGAITAVDFKFSSGNADAGKIKVWGVK
jgi:hypothetical protein